MLNNDPILIAHCWHQSMTVLTSNIITDYLELAVTDTLQQAYRKL